MYALGGVNSKLLYNKSLADGITVLYEERAEPGMFNTLEKWLEAQWWRAKLNSTSVRTVLLQSVNSLQSLNVLVEMPLLGLKTEGSNTLDLSRIELIHMR